MDNLKKIYEFLEELKQNNDRDWFNAHREEYDKARKIFEEYVQKVINRIAIFDPSVMPVKVKDCMFRIYRDVRFSPNKEPYKTHFGAYINPRGRKSDSFGYYIHLEPGSSILAGGSIGLPTKRLNLIREAIYQQVDVYIDIVEDPIFKKYFPTVGMDFLKTAPKGFPKDFEHIDYLKCREYVCSCDIADDFVLKSTALDEIGDAFEQAKRYGDFINEALGY